MSALTYLKKYSQRSHGFTLVELMVVISILAVLAVVGLSVFSGAQAQARDAKRRGEIDAIAKSIEGSRDVTTGIYSYTTTKRDSDFPASRGGLPNDPKSPIVYCVNTSTTTTIPADPTAAEVTGWTTATCPGTYTALATSITTATSGNLGATTPDVKAWTLCAKMEQEADKLYCVRSTAGQ